MISKSHKSEHAWVKKYRAAADERFNLRSVDPDETGGIEDKQAAHDELGEVHKKLCSLQQLIYAEGRHAVLVVLQAMDTGGKDGAIRRVFGPLNPQGVRVTGFKAPTSAELAHDYLWRIHKVVPAKGMIGIFNRSHYEDVLAVKVRKLATAAVVNARYAQINAFEKYLVENDVTVLKFFLHISRDEQRERLQARVDDPEKHWKFDPGDLAERKRWNAYMGAFETAVRKCSTHYAPWYVVPANRKWYRDVVIARILCEVLEGLHPRFPKAVAGIKDVKVPR